MTKAKYPKPGKKTKRKAKSSTTKSPEAYALLNAYIRGYNLDIIG